MVFWLAMSQDLAVSPRMYSYRWGAISKIFLLDFEVQSVGVSELGYFYDCDDMMCTCMYYLEIRLVNDEIVSKENRLQRDTAL